MTEIDTWERDRSEQVADCRVFSVRRDVCVRMKDATTSDFYVIESPNWVNIIALTHDRDIVMIEQFRHGTEEINLELPGGLIDDGEEPDAAAARELLEETGFSSSNWIKLGSSHPNPAIQNNTIHHFLAVDCEKTSETAFDPNESIITRLVREDEVNDLIVTGKITHSLVVAAFFYFRCRS